MFERMGPLACSSGCDRWHVRATGAPGMLEQLGSNHATHHTHLNHPDHSIASHLPVLAPITVMASPAQLHQTAASIAAGAHILRANRHLPIHRPKPSIKRQAGSPTDSPNPPMHPISPTNVALSNCREPASTPPTPSTSNYTAPQCEVCTNNQHLLSYVRLPASHILPMVFKSCSVS